LKFLARYSGKGALFYAFQSPRGDFGFLKVDTVGARPLSPCTGFNPLAGILVF